MKFNKDFSWYEVDQKFIKAIEMYNQLELCNPGKHQHKKNRKDFKLTQDRMRILK